MKYVITIIVLGAILGGIALKKSQPNEYVNAAPEVVTKEVVREVQTLEMRIADAQNASSTDIENEAQAAYEAKKQQMLTEIELKITTQYKKEIEARETQLEKEVGTY